MHVVITDVPLAKPVMKVQVKQGVALLKIALAEKESAYPLQYLAGHGKMYKNL